MTESIDAASERVVELNEKALANGEGRRAPPSSVSDEKAVV